MDSSRHPTLPVYKDTNLYYSWLRWKTTALKLGNSNRLFPQMAAYKGRSVPKASAFPPSPTKPSHTHDGNLSSSSADTREPGGAQPGGAGHWTRAGTCAEGLLKRQAQENTFSHGTKLRLEIARCWELPTPWPRRIEITKAHNGHLHGHLGLLTWV